MMLLKMAVICLSTLVVTSLLPFTADNGQCRSDWTYILGSCYVYAEREASWADAETFCLSAGGTLAEIERSTLNVQLKREVIQHGAECVWLGGIDVLRQMGEAGPQGDNWQWASTGKPINVFHDWAYGEPNNLGPGDYCLALSQRYTYQWATFPCDYKCKFICQKTRAGRTK